MSLDKRYNNTGGSSGGSGTGGVGVIDRFEAAEDQTIFNLNQTLSDNTLVLINGDDVSPDLYSGNTTQTLTFNNALSAADKVTVIGVVAGISINRYTANVNQTTFVASKTITSATLVLLNGDDVFPVTDYTSVGSQLIFNYPLAENDKITIIS